MIKSFYIEELKVCEKSNYMLHDIWAISGRKSTSLTTPKRTNMIGNIIHPWRVRWLQYVKNGYIF